MSNPSKRKGTAAETAVVACLHGHGIVHAERRVLHGANDQGDITGWPDRVIEVKNQKQYGIPAWLRELDVEQVNAGASVGCVVFKLRGVTDPNQWPALMRFGNWIELAKDADS
jgi:hypothetical protein